MMKKFVLVAGFLGALASGSAFAQCAGDVAAAIGGFNVANPSVPGTVGTTDAPAVAANTCVCNGIAQRTSVNGGGGQEVVPGVARFIRNGFTVSCSANSMVTMSDLAAARFAVSGASRRGNQMHMGSSATGAVRVEARAGGARSCGTVANPLCTSADLTAALARAEAEVPAP